MLFMGFNVFVPDLTCIHIVQAMTNVSRRPCFKPNQTQGNFSFKAKVVKYKIFNWRPTWPEQEIEVSK